MVEAIAADMRARGFAEEHPLALWKGHKSTILDGHTRAAAADAAGIVDVPVVMVECADEAAALEYAIRCQRNRRNLTAAELLRCIEELDKRCTKAEAGAMAHGEQTQDCVSSGPSSEATAELLGVSPRTVERLRTVNDHAPAEVREAMASGGMSVNAAYEATQAARRTAKPLPDIPPQAKLDQWDRNLEACEEKIPRKWWPALARVYQNRIARLNEEWDATDVPDDNASS